MPAVLGLADPQPGVVYRLRLACARRPDAIFSLALFRIHTYSVGLLGNLFARIGTGAMPYLIPLLLQVSLGYSRSPQA